MKKFIITGMTLIILLYNVNIWVATANEINTESAFLSEVIAYLTKLRFMRIENKKLTDYMYERILYWQEQIKIDRPKLEKDTKQYQGRC